MYLEPKAGAEEHFVLVFVQTLRLGLKWTGRDVKLNERPIGGRGPWSGGPSPTDFDRGRERRRQSQMRGRVEAAKGPGLVLWLGIGQSCDDCFLGLVRLCVHLCLHAFGNNC